MEKQLVKIDPKEFGLNESEAVIIEESFVPISIERDGLINIYDEILKSEITPELCERAGKLNTSLSKINASYDRIHKIQKAYFWSGGKFVDALKNKNKIVIEEMQNNLRIIRDHFVNIENERKESLKKIRENELMQLDVDVTFYNLAEMPEESYLKLLESSKLQLQLKKDAELKAENERIELEKAEAEERERVKLENEKLKAEAEEREKRFSEERAKAESERIKLEKENQIKLGTERKEREKIQSELRAKEESERKEKQRLLDEEQKRIKAGKDALKAPDKAKLTELATRIVSIQMPDVKSDEAKAILLNVQELLNKTSNYIKEKSLSL